MSILVSQLLKKMEAPRVDESQARTRASLLKKNKASNEKTLSVQADSREGRDPEGPTELKDTLYLKTLERGSNVFRPQKCTGR